MKVRLPFTLKRFMPRSLLGRSLLILVIPVLLIQVITTYVFFDRHWSKMTSRLAYAVAGEIALIVQEVEADTSHEAFTDLSVRSARHLDLNLERVKGELAQGMRYSSVHVWESMVAQTLARELESQLDRKFFLDMAFNEKWVRVSVQLETGILKVTLPQRRLFSSSGYIFLLWMIGASLLLLMIAILFMRNQIRPIRKLAAAAERFGKGRELPSFKPEGAKEVRQAAQSFIDMHRRIRRQVEQRTAMLAGVSHDLRTPLTRLKLQIAMLKASSDVEAMKEDIADMEHMIEGYLDFVRGEGDEQVSITGLAGIITKLETLARAHGVEVISAMERDIHLMLRPMAFERALSNIVNNAAKYADHIWISVSEKDDGEKLQIVIEDNGPGICEDQYEEVFRPFYRVDSSRNLSTGGVGLGLPIAMDVVQTHGGNITLDKSCHGGLKVIIRLPL